MSRSRIRPVDFPIAGQSDEHVLGMLLNLLVLQVSEERLMTARVSQRVVIYLSVNRNGAADLIYMIAFQTVR